MKKRTNFLFLAFFSFLFVNGQESLDKVQGRVFSASNDVTGVHVSNTSINRGTITDFNGYFEISVGLGDILVFSAVQFERKEVLITEEILEAPLFLVPLKDSLTELNEVVVTPYNLLGDLNRDMDKLKTGPIITASTENLPNANVQLPAQSQRKLYTARTWDLEIGFGFKVKTDPLINYFSGRTKRLKKRIVRETRSKWIDEVRGFYPDSFYIQQLKIPKSSVGNFIYSCEKDSLFEATAKNGNRLQLWEVLKKKSIKYLEDNDLEKK